MKSLSVREAALLLGQSLQFVRIGIQQGRLPIGIAVKMSTHVYDIRPNLLADYMGITVEELFKRLDEIQGEVA